MLDRPSHPLHRMTRAEMDAIWNAAVVRNPPPPEQPLPDDRWDKDHPILDVERPYRPEREFVKLFRGGW